MPWYRQLDNKGNETQIKRFFTDAQERGLKAIMSKTKRVRWTLLDKAVHVAPGEVAKPTKSVTIVDVHNAETVKELEKLKGKTDNRGMITAIENKIKSLTNKNK